MTIGDGDKPLDGDEAFRLATANEAGGDEPETEVAEAASDEVETEQEPEGEREAETEAPEGQIRDPATGKFVPKQSAAVKTDGKKKPAGEEQQDHRVPLSEHLSEREKRQAAERRAEALERELTTLKQPKREQPAAIDPYADPQAFRDAGIREALSPLEQRLENQRLATSKLLAVDKYGSDVVNTAFTTLKQAMETDPAARFEYQRIMASDHPYAELVGWSKRQSALKEIGDDPAAYETKLREKLLSDPEFAKQVIERQRSDKRPAGTGTRSNIDLPPSLNSASGNGANSDRVAPVNDGELLNSFFSRAG